MLILAMEIDVDTKKPGHLSIVPAHAELKDVALAYHYTVGQHAMRIRRTGIIKPATAYVEKPELPVVWFSSNAVYECTIAKGIAGTGTPPRTATFEEMVSFGLIRLAIPICGLHSWSELQELAHIPLNIARGLERHARDIGANPSEWFGSLEPVSISRVVKVEMADIGGGWRNVTPQFELNLFHVVA